MNIIHISSEANPFVKTGGLADVVFSLSKELVSLNNNVAIFLPYYQNIASNGHGEFVEVLSFTQKMDWRSAETKVYKTVYKGIDYYFVSNDHYFLRQSIYGENDDNERFAFFARAAITSIAMLNLNPNVIHCHDWQAGMVPCLIKEQHIDYYLKTKFVFTIHNPLFKGAIGVDDYTSFFDLDRELYYNGTLRYGESVSSLKAGIMYSDMVTTVSPTHKTELLDPLSNMGLAEILGLKGNKFVGILNGCDYDEFSPEKDQHLPVRYSSEDFFTKKNIIRANLMKNLGLVDNGKPVFSFISRLTWQKGIDNLLAATEVLAKNENVVIILSSGESKEKGKLEALKKKYPKYICTLFIFDNDLAHYVYAGSDFFLMPSVFEPCGLSQIIAMRYGTMPIVRLTGGLNDTVTPYDGTNLDIATGFAFKNSDNAEFIDVIKKAYKCYFNLSVRKKIISNAMSVDFSWKKSAKEYLDIYTQLINNY